MRILCKLKVAELDFFKQNINNKKWEKSLHVSVIMKNEEKNVKVCQGFVIVMTEWIFEGVSVYYNHMHDMRKIVSVIFNYIFKGLL